MSLHVVVIGAGIVGAATAVELLRDGHRVTVIEPGTPGGTQAASFGNGAWLSPASVVPMSMPGLWKKVPGYLLDPLGPLTIRWTALPELAPWLLRFILAGATVPKVEATARALSALLSDSPLRHKALATEAGLGDLIVQGGLLYPFLSRREFEAEALAWRLRRDNGVVWRELDGAALRDYEPLLAPRYGFGVLVEAGGHCQDPGAYVAGLVAYAQLRGAQVRQTHATAFDLHGGRLHGVRTPEGVIPCDRAVIAAGVRSKALAAAAGDRVSLASERGYHVVVADPEVRPRTPIMPSDGKMADTLTRTGLRASGQVELAGIDAAPNWRRADVLLDRLIASYPGLPRTIPEARLSRWMGHRPSTPDGLPVIGPASHSADIIHAFGHGHVGLASGPITARIAADLISGRAPTRTIAPYAAARFR
ncbi:MAG: amino acid dehydrogenase [Azorhizobium sp. 35-67-5]|nr:MAG: amino acid dehydrogenase [Azorhizobium sp. 35-67-5]